LHADRGEISPQTVVADFTTTIGFAKRGLVADRATAHVGRLCILPLNALTEAASADDNQSREHVATADALSTTLRRRAFDVHKGLCGRVAIVAGSPGMTGAAAMCAKGCVRAGAGLVTLITTPDLQPIMAVLTVPEVMVRVVESYREILDLDFDAVAIGPGLGDRHHDDVVEIISQSRVPTVIDADALSIVSRAMKTLEECAGPRLLTPHPGEMARLDSASTQRTRRETAEAFTARWPHTLLLKGARTLVAQREVGISYNTTGNPGMASGGMGDVLTGVCAALAGQKLSLFDAARMGAWLCGRAAELAIFNGTESEQSLCASDVIDHLGRAFRDVHACVW
jgi:NAD(P)H-hydrate epimerase